MIKKQVHVTWEGMKSHKGLVALSMLLDFVFLVVMSAILSVTFQLIAPPLQELQGMLDKIDLSNINATITGPSQMGFAHAYTAMMFSIVIMFVVMLIAWLLLQGAAWFAAHKICGRKVTPLAFSLRFVCVTIVACIVILTLFAMIGNASAALSRGILSPSSDVIGYASVVCLVIMMYFLTAAYASIDKLRAWSDYASVLRKYWKSLLAAYGVLIVIVLLANLILPLALGISIWLTYFLTIVLVLPAYAFARVLLIESAS